MLRRKEALSRKSCMMKPDREKEKQPAESKYRLLPPWVKFALLAIFAVAAAMLLLPDVQSGHGWRVELNFTVIDASTGAQVEGAVIEVDPTFSPDDNVATAVTDAAGRAIVKRIISVNDRNRSPWRWRYRVSLDSRVRVTRIGYAPLTLQLQDLLDDESPDRTNKSITIQVPLRQIKQK